MTEEAQGMKRLFRSRVDRYIAGVSGGLGEYFHVDSNIFRILFVVFTFFGGFGLLLYIASLIIVPENPSHEAKPVKKESNKTVLWALLLIIIGFALLFKEFGFFNYFQFWHLPWSSIWAIFLILLGVLLVLSANKPAGTSENNTGENTSSPPEVNRIYRSRRERMLAGVCAGIANYFNIDPSIVRILWVLATLASIGLGILVYVILIFVFQEEPDETENT